MQSVGNWQIDTEQSQNGVIFSCLKRQRSLRESVTTLLKGKHSMGQEAGFAIALGKERRTHQCLH